VIERFRQPEVVNQLGDPINRLNCSRMDERFLCAIIFAPDIMGMELRFARAKERGNALEIRSGLSLIVTRGIESPSRVTRLHENVIDV
jgi:hypothetical protein